MLRKNFKLLSIILSICLLATAIFPLGATAKQVNGINYYAVDPIAYYTFDGEVLGADTYGNYPLTDMGWSPVVDGVCGNAVSFNADHMYAPFLYNANLLEGATDFTVSVDAKLNEGVTADNHTIFSNGWQDQGGLSFGYSSHEWMFITADATGGDWIAFNIKSALGVDTFDAYAWHNFTLTVKNGVQLAVYIDGVLAHSATLSDTLNTVNASYPFAIGTTHSGGYPFLGSIDNVKVFDKGFTGTQVSELYTDGKTYASTITEPVARYTFDGEDLGADTFGSYPLASSGLATSVTGNSGNAAHFDNQHMFSLFLSNAADPLEGKSDFTVSAFAKLDAGVTSDQHGIFSNGGWGNGGVTFDLNTHEWIHINVDTSAGTQDLGFNIASALGDTSFDAHEWHNYSLTVKGGTALSVYIDGTLAYTTTLPGAISTTNTASAFVVGTSFNGGYPFVGAIDTVNVYNFALNAAEIRTVMEGKELSDDGEILPEATYNFDMMDVYADATGNHDMSSETSVTVAKGYNGNAGVFAATGWMDTLKGVTDFTDALSEISISMFAKQDSSAMTENACMFSTGWDGANDDRAGFSIGLVNGYVFFDGELTDNSTVVWRTVYANVDTTEWHQYGMSISNGGKTLSIYIDGDKVFTETFALPLNLNWTDDWYTYAIGASFSRDGYIFKGMLDEVNVYATGLTDNQMKQAYYGETIQSVLYGDVNNDGIIDVRDLVRLKKVVAKTVTASEQICDVNKDGENDALDLGALRKEILSKKKLK